MEFICDYFSTGRYVIVKTGGGESLYGHMKEHGYKWSSPPPTFGNQSTGAYTEDHIGLNMDNGQWNTEMLSPYMPWNNSQPEENLPAEPDIQPGTLWSVGNVVTNEPSGQDLYLSRCNGYSVFCVVLPREELFLQKPVLQLSFQPCTATQHHCVLQDVISSEKQDTPSSGARPSDNNIYLKLKLHGYVISHSSAK